MQEFEISLGKGKTEKNWKTKYYTWDEFVERLKKVRRTKETLDQYNRMDKATKGRVKDGPAFVGGAVKGGRRKRDSVNSRSLITLDADFANSDFANDVDFVLAGFSYAIYSTHSHRENKQKYRLIVPLERTVTPDEYVAVSRKLADDIGLEYFDKTTFDIHRLMYFPSCSKDATPVLKINSGKFLSPESVLEEYEDWTDVLAWPRHDSVEVAIANKLKKVQDPTDKFGVIGLFCRAFDIESGIETFLSDQYVKGTIPHRYTYTGGTSANGLEVYIDENLAYSHQDSDPVSDGRAYNIFDLVRVHKFGALDEDYIEGSKATRPSIIAMEKWAMQQEEVKTLASKEQKAEFEEFENLDFEEEENWETKIARNKTSGKPLSNSMNMELILSNGDFKGCLAYDAFGNTEVIRSKLPWRDKERSELDYEPWLAADDNRLRHYLSKRYDVRGNGIIIDAFKEVTRRNTFHPIKEYLESEVWDGNKRLDTLFIDYLGAENCEYVRTVTRKMFIAAVSRVYCPGCKFDEMLVLVGVQGIGKSTILAKMGGIWFSDSLKNFESKEAGEHLQSGWIFELSELSAMKKTEIEEAKAFLSKTEDR